MLTGIVSNSTLCLPLLHYLKAQQYAVTVFSDEQVLATTGSIAHFCAGAGFSCTCANGDDAALYKWVTEQQPDIVFIIGYGRKIATERFIAKKPECFNVHFGHLPEYRGPTPVFWQLKKGMSALAISIHCIDKQLDAGAIAWQKEYTNQPFFSYGYVHQLLSHYLVEGVSYLLQIKNSGQAIPVTPQEEKKAAYYNRPSLQDVCIEWNKMEAEEICHLIKACNPWNGGAVTTYNGFEVRISDAECVTAALDQPTPTEKTICAGTILENVHAFKVACINGKMINIHSLTMNGILMPGRFAVNYGFMKDQLFKTI